MYILSYFLGVFTILALIFIYNYVLKLILKSGSKLVADGHEIKMKMENTARELYKLEKELWPQG